MHRTLYRHLGATLAVFLLLTGFHVQAQKNKKEIDWSLYTTEQIIRQGDEAFEDANYYGCMPYYDHVLNEDPTNIYCAHKLAKANEFVLDYKKAAYYFAIVVDGSSSEYPLARYDYAAMLKRNGKYEQAITEFSTFSKRYRGDNGDYFRNAAKREIDGCKFAVKAMETPLDLEIENMGEPINSAYYELAPVLVDNNTMIFSSLPSDTIIEVKTKKEEKTYVTKIYKTIKENELWQEPKELEANVNNPLYHAANGSFSMDGTRFYFSRCTDILDEMMCAIYVCDYQDGKFGEARILGEQINKIDHSSTQPSVGRNKDGDEVMFFSSTRPGGSGGYDIWVAELKDNGEFKNVRNLGTQINTTENEVTPYYDRETETFYFSSEGHVGLGGFDIYRAKGDGKNWREPINMGYPINSSVDDLYFVLDRDRKDGFNDGFLVSNRSGSITLKSETCCNDIYRFEWNRPPVFAVQGYVLKKGDPEKKPINDAKVTITIDLPRPEQDSIAKRSWVTQDDSMYFFTLDLETAYTLNAAKTDFFGDKGAKVSTVGKTESDTFRVDLYLEQFELEKTYTIKNIYYDYDEATLRPESKNSLDELLDLLNEHKHLVVEIGSHTDSRGSATYNKKLSLNRAKSVVQYLIAAGIPKDRLVAKGYGEEQPIAPNENPDGSDNPEGRQKNRRTEFKIIGKLDGKLNIIN